MNYINKLQFIEYKISKNITSNYTLDQKRDFLILASIHTELIHHLYTFKELIPEVGNQKPKNKYKNYLFQNNFIGLISTLHESHKYFVKTNRSELIPAVLKKYDNLYKKIRDNLGYHYSYEKPFKSLIEHVFDVYILNNDKDLLVLLCNKKNINIFTDVSELKWRLMYFISHNPNWKNECDDQPLYIKSKLQEIEDKPEVFEEWFEDFLFKTNSTAKVINKLCAKILSDLM